MDDFWFGFDNDYFRYDDDGWSDEDTNDAYYNDRDCHDPGDFEDVY